MSSANGMQEEAGMGGREAESAVVDALHHYWILGEGAERKAPRWSILRDVPGWVDRGSVWGVPGRI